MHATRRELIRAFLALLTVFLQGMKNADLDVSAANSYIALAAGDDFRGLSWMTIDLRHDPEEVIEKAEGDGKGRIERERL